MLMLAILACKTEAPNADAAEPGAMVGSGASVEATGEGDCELSPGATGLMLGLGVGQYVVELGKIKLEIP